MAVVERFKQESMYGLFVYQEKKGRCREVAVVGGGTWLCAYLDPVPLVIASKGLEIIPSLK